MDNNIDYDKLEALKESARLPGEYLIAWNVIHQHLKQSGSKIDYRDYAIAFDENESEYIVRFGKFFKKKVLGGGIGTCRISKEDLSIIEFKLIR